MKAFLHKHVLIPPVEGAMPYFFLIFLIPLIILLLPIDSWEKVLLVLLLGAFLKAYREGYVENSSKNSVFLIMISISIIFLLYNGYASLFIYIGWQFPFWPIKKATFRNYLAVYLVTLLSTSAYSLIVSSDSIQPEEWLWIAVGLGFAVMSPFAARSVEKTRREMYDLTMTNSRLSTLVRQNERERIARDLHDHLGQSYSTIALKAELAKKLLAIDINKAAMELDDIEQTSRENLNTVRKIVSNLHEQTIASAMIESADLLETGQIKMYSENEEQTNDWPLYIQFALASIIQEATTNIIRHSQATLVTYHFNKEAKNYRLKIKDNGVGIQFNAKKTHGISGMRNRVEDLRGLFEITNHSGTIINVTLPEEEFEYEFD